jgi:hypothetical protein
MKIGIDIDSDEENKNWDQINGLKHSYIDSSDEFEIKENPPVKISKNGIQSENNNSKDSKVTVSMFKKSRNLSPKKLLFYDGNRIFSKDNLEPKTELKEINEKHGIKVNQFSKDMKSQINKVGLKKKKKISFGMMQENKNAEKQSEFDIKKGNKKNESYFDDLKDFA